VTPEVAEALGLVANALLQAVDGLGATTAAAQVPAADLTAAEIAVRFGRRPSTVRVWLEAGRFPGHKLNHREWRIPPAALVAFEESARNSEAPRLTSSRSKPANLSAWRSAS
jgi:helix-turn-helix protein